MAIYHLYTVLCEKLVIGKDGKPTAVALFQNIELPGLPASRESIGIIVALKGDTGDACRVTLEAPDGRTLGEVASFTLEAPAEVGKYREWAFTVVGEVRPAVFTQEGRHRICLWHGEELVHEYPFGVFVKDTEEQKNGD